MRFKKFISSLLSCMLIFMVLPTTGLAVTYYTGSSYTMPSGRDTYSIQGQWSNDSFTYTAYSYSMTYGSKSNKDGYNDYNSFEEMLKGAADGKYTWTIPDSYSNSTNSSGDSITTLDFTLNTSEQYYLMLPSSSSDASVSSKVIISGPDDTTDYIESDAIVIKATNIVICAPSSAVTSPINSKLTFSGGLEITGGATVNLPGCYTTNTGATTVDYVFGGDVKVSGRSTLTVTSSREYDTEFTFNNSGSLIVDSTSTVNLGYVTMSGGSTDTPLIQNAGTVNILTASMSSDNPTFTSAGTVISNTGTLNLGLGTYTTTSTSSPIIDMKGGTLTLSTNLADNSAVDLSPNITTPTNSTVSAITVAGGASVELTEYFTSNEGAVVSTTSTDEAAISFASGATVTIDGVSYTVSDSAGDDDANYVDNDGKLHLSSGATVTSTDSEELSVEDITANLAGDTYYTVDGEIATAEYTVNDCTHSITEDEETEDEASSGALITAVEAVNTAIKVAVAAYNEENKASLTAKDVTVTQEDKVTEQVTLANDGSTIVTMDVEPYISVKYDDTDVLSETKLDTSDTYATAIIPLMSGVFEEDDSVIVSHEYNGGSKYYAKTVEAVEDDAETTYSEYITVLTTSGFSTWTVSEFSGTAASAINVVFEQVTDEDGEAVSGQYYVKLVGSDDDEDIYRFSAAQLGFKFNDSYTDDSGETVECTILDIGALSITEGDQGYSPYINITDKGDGEYLFSLDGTDYSDITGHEIILGIAQIAGVGTFSLGIDEDYETNQVQTAVYPVDDNGDADTNSDGTLADNNIVRTYSNDDDVASDDSELNLNSDAGDDGTADGNVDLETSKLTINVVFPNAVETQTMDYTNMKVTVTGLNVDETVYLGTTGTDTTLTVSGEQTDSIDITYAADGDETGTLSGYYGFTVEVPVYQNYAYTLEFSGDGYRTYRTTIVPTAGEATVTVWNNVMDSDMVVISKDSADSAVYKATTFLAGEIVADNEINLYDLSAVVSYFGKTDITDADYIKYDLNRDNKIDSKDIAMVLVSWGK